MENKNYLDIRNRTVTKANELIQKSRFSLSLLQQKVVLYLISQISPYDEDFKLYQFSIQEFCKVCGLDFDSGGNYEYLKKTIQDISDKSIWITLPNGKATLIRWIERPYIDYKSGIIEIKLDELMKPYLLQLKQNFTSYELIYTLHFRSKYTIRLYELIKSIHFHELNEYKRKYTVDELKILLDGTNYKEYRDFKRKIVDKAVAEINEYSDKDISYTEIKRGRKVLELEFTISSKSSLDTLKIRDSIEKELGIDPDQLTLWDKLEQKGLVQYIYGYLHNFN